MNVKTAKKPKPRIDTGYLSLFNMQTYGYDNLYPQHLQRITAASGTAELCLNRYAKFIEGNGFNDTRLSEYVVNHQGTTLDELLHDIAGDIARFGGFAIHVNYNVLCEISDMTFIPFEMCRLEEEDDAGYVGHILIHPDWTGKKRRGGIRLTVNEDNIRRINTFNPDPRVVALQIEAAGGIENYKGQVLWCSMDGKDIYPTPIYDAAITDISTDEGLGNIKYRNVRYNFLTACMLVTKKGEPPINGDSRDDSENHMIGAEDLMTFQGDENTGKIMLVEIENEESAPEVVNFPSRNFDKEFTVTDVSVTERIYAQFHQELFYAIRIGKLGFSGQVMQDAYEYYAGEVTNEQRFIGRAIVQIFSHWHDTSVADADLSIEPLRYISAEREQENEGEAPDNAAGVRHTGTSGKHTSR